MLRIIRRKLALEQCDENMEVSWSMMWNITGGVFVWSTVLNLYLTLSAP